MGKYVDSLGRRLRNAPPTASGERLVSVAIKRNGEVLARGFKSHYELRQALDPDAGDWRYGEPGDVDGFLTSSGRFLTRREAQPIAVAAGQLREEMRRELLSSDLIW